MWNLKRATSRKPKVEQWLPELQSGRVGDMVCTCTNLQLEDKFWRYNTEHSNYGQQYSVLYFKVAEIGFNFFSQKRNDNYGHYSNVRVHYGGNHINIYGYI